METAQISENNWIEEVVVYIYIYTYTMEYYATVRKKQNHVICCPVDGTIRYYSVLSQRKKDK